MSPTRRSHHTTACRRQAAAQPALCYLMLIACSGLLSSIVRPAAAEITFNPLTAMAEAVGNGIRGVTCWAHGRTAAPKPASQTAADNATWEVADWRRPPFCSHYDCPQYEVLERYGDGVQLRRYKAASWVIAKVYDADSFDEAVSRGFSNLFRYLFGDNEDCAFVPMTTPVVTAVHFSGRKKRDERFSSTFYVSFFVPFSYQDRPPEPLNRDLFVKNFRNFDVYVRSFDGYATNCRVRTIATDFLDGLREHRPEGRRACRCTFLVAIYDPPLKVFKRHNEIWAIRTDRCRAAATDEGGWPDDDPSGPYPIGNDDDEGACEEDPDIDPPQPDPPSPTPPLPPPPPSPFPPDPAPAPPSPPAPPPPPPGPPPPFVPPGNDDDAVPSPTIAPIF